MNKSLINHLSRNYISEEVMEKYLEIISKKQIKSEENKIFAQEINKILKKFNIKERINFTHLIRIKNDIVLNYLTTNDPKRLARIIEEYIWEIAKKNTYLYHFTKKEYADSIEKTHILRLYNILKRYSDGEIKDFLNDFKIPFEIQENYKEVFYLSFTTKIPSIADKSTIREFRNFTGSCGARLKFKVTQEDNNLKKINYEKYKFEIIHELRESIKNKFNVELIINGFTTKFASFYVNEKYSSENEVRLYKNLLFDKNYKIEIDENNQTYIEFDLKGSCLELEEVIYESEEEIFN